MGELKEYCGKYYSAVAIFGNLFPTAWVLGMDLPRQAEDLEGKFGMGPGIALAQGSIT